MTTNREVIFNLWYVYDQTETIYFLLGRSYAGFASEAESREFLRKWASTDHRVAQYFPVPSRFQTSVICDDGTTQALAVIHTRSCCTTVDKPLK